MQRSAEAGFTLAELLVVLAILSLTLAIAFPSATRFGTARELCHITTALAAELRRIEAAGLAEGREKRITLTLRDNEILLSGRENPIVLPEGTKVEIRSASDESVGETGFFAFFPDGGSTGGRILLERGEKRTEITVNWLTGAIAVTQGTGQ